MESIFLMGSEDVSKAGYSMRDAAATMRSAASSIDESLRQHQRFLDDWLQRFEAALTQGVPKVA